MKNKRLSYGYQLRCHIYSAVNLGPSLTDRTTEAHNSKVSLTANLNGYKATSAKKHALRHVEWFETLVVPLHLPSAPSVWPKVCVRLEKTEPLGRKVDLGWVLVDTSSVLPMALNGRISPFWFEISEYFDETAGVFQKSRKSGDLPKVLMAFELLRKSDPGCERDLPVLYPEKEV